MSERSIAILIEDLLEAIHYSRQFTNNMTYEQFSEDVLVNSAVLRQLEIIGEVARVIPSEVKTATPLIPWHKIKGFRNRIIHEYFDVSLSTVWFIVTEELPGLKQQLLPLLKLYQEKEGFS